MENQGGAAAPTPPSLKRDPLPHINRFKIQARSSALLSRGEQLDLFHRLRVFVMAFQSDFDERL